ncbi:unnamed protein product [Rhizophagus irregularis]|nr:unnamed protein product [Rhizophagus irregularis]
MIESEILSFEEWYKEAKNFNIKHIEHIEHKVTEKNNIKHEDTKNDMTFQHLNDVRSNYEIHPNNKHQVLKRKKYGRSYGLSKRAIQISIDCDDNEVENFLENYIKQKEHELENNKVRMNRLV